MSGWGAETIKITYIITGLAVLALLACLAIVSDESDADPSEITVSGTVSGSDYGGANAWSDSDVNKVTIAFVSDDHVVITDVVDKHYSVTLKANHDYNVRSFNNVGFDGILKTGTGVSQMHYIFYKDIHTGESDLSLDVNLTKFYKNYTTDSKTIGKYYLYKIGDARIATLHNLDDAVKLDSKGIVSEDQTITIPEYVTYEGEQYKVTFVGKGISYVSSIFTKPASTFRGDGTLTIRFQGDVILNSQPFTATYSGQYGSTTSDQFKFNLVFEKDVYVNSPASYTNNQLMMMPSRNALIAIENVSISGVYHGAIQYLQGVITRTTGNWGLANTNFESIVFDSKLVPTGEGETEPSMVNATVGLLGLSNGTMLTADLDQNSGKFVLKNGDLVICNSVSNVASNSDELTTVADPVTIKVVNGDSVTYLLVTKGQTKVLDEPAAPEGKGFDGWYEDFAFTRPYNSNEGLNANMTVYAKYITTEITVSGTVSGSDSNWTDDKVNKITVAFVSDDDVVITDVVDKHYSVTLKANHDYNVRSFNNVGFDSILVTGTGVSQMHYIFYKDIHTGESDLSLDVNLTKFYKNYTTDSKTIGKYYLYKIGDARIATLHNLDDAVKLDSKGIVSEDQTITIPEYVTYEGEQYKVTFIGKGVSAYAGLFTKPSQVYHGDGVVTIRFQGDVVLNYQPFTAPQGGTNAGSPTSDKFKFNLVFEKDVYVNSVASYTNNQLMMSPSYKALTAIENVSIGGVYHGATQYLQGVMTRTTGNWGLANTNFESIVFDSKLVPSDVNDDYSSMVNATVGSLGLSNGTMLTADLDQNSGKFVLKNGNAVVCNSVDAIYRDPVVISEWIGGSVFYILAQKGEPIILTVPDADEGYKFDDWYGDANYSQKYNPNGVLDSNITVYANFVPKQYNIAIYGDGITVKNGDNVVADGSKIAFETGLTLALEERVGYRAIVKLDGAVVSGTTVNVPAKDFIITCEWVAIPYTVKCMDGETVVKTFENCRLGDVISLPAIDKAGFTGWSVENGMLLGAQYVVSYGDVGANDTITLIASFTELQDAVWELTVTGGDGKAFWTKSNAIGSYGIVTVLPAEFEKASVSIDPAVDGAYVGKLSDNTYMVYSANGGDVTVAIAFQSVEKSSEYTVSLVEIAKEGSPGFRATVAATDGGIVDTSGKLSIRYVYKAMDEASGLWCFTTSGQTTGVDDYVVPLGGANDKAYSVTGDFYLNSIEAADGAYLVYGYASYAFGDSSVTAETTVVTSPVIMSVSEIQAVVSKS